MDVKEHCDLLIDEGNDPVYDDELLKDYMNKWDGKVFVESMKLNKNKAVLEIGVGTGRIAVKTAPLCREFYGIDISLKTASRAKVNLQSFKNAIIFCGDFLQFNFDIKFDVIYSSLTFMHIEEKEKCIKKVFNLLNINGIFVLSIDKNQNEFLDFGNRKIKIYPDDINKTKTYISDSGFEISKVIETEFAYIIVAENK